MDGLDLLAVQGLSSLLQHHSSKASILQHPAFFIVQLSHPYMTTGKTIFQEDMCTSMFTVALFTIVRTWKKSRYSLTDEWIKKLWYIYTM